MSGGPAGSLLAWAVRAAGLLVVLQMAYAFVPDRHAGWATALVVAAFLAASLLAAAARSGPAYAAAIAGTGLVVGAVAEAVGVATGVPFGDYAYTDRLGPRLLDVPLVVPLAWAMMAYPAWRVAETLAGRRAMRVLVAALALAAWDVALDPQMVGFGFWDWPGGGPYEDVPLSNFAGWVVVGVVLFALWTLLEPRRAPHRPDAVADGLGLLLYAWTWLGETVAHLVFWGRPAAALATFACMGALAVPALVRWSRRHGLGAAGAAREVWAAR